MGADEFTDEKTIVADRESTTSTGGVGPESAYLVVIAGPNIGEMFSVGDGGVIGRGNQCRFRLRDNEISRNHARIVLRAGVVLVEDLGSTNGTAVNGGTVRAQSLKDGDKIQVGSTTILKFTYHDDLEEEFQRRMYESALRDGLTQVYNKAFFTERFEAEFAFAKRQGSVLSLGLFDLDHFKQVNDRFGHLAGDHVLREFADIVTSLVDENDLFARYGGEEFIWLSRRLDLDAALAFGESVRRRVAEAIMAFEGQRIPVTVSIGMASLPSATIDAPDALIAAADEALYAAKRAGRDRVEAHRG